MMNDAGSASAAGNPSVPPDVAPEVAGLVDGARKLWELQKLAESEAPLRQALALAERASGPDGLLASYVLAHLAWLASARGQYADAVRDYRRVLTIRDRDLGTDHADTLHAAEELAAALFQADARDPDVDALAVRAIAGYEAAGRDDAELAALIACVAWRRYWIGRYLEAEPLLLRGLAMQERLLGLGNPATAETAQRLAIMYDHRGFANDPEPFYRKALDGYEVVHDSGHPAVLESRFRLADFLRRRGRYEEAGPLFDGLVTAFLEDSPAGDQARIHWMISGCCTYLRNVGREPEAEALEARAQLHDPVVELVRAQAEQAEAAHGPDSVELAQALSQLAGTLVQAGRADEAEETARRCLTIYRARAGAEDPSSVLAAHRLSTIRERAESSAADPRGRRLGDDENLLFDPFTRPWDDERRPDLIRAYLASLSDGDDDPEGSQVAITAMTFSAGLETQWEVILDLITQAEDDPDVLGDLAAGPLEGFLGKFDTAAIDRVEDEAARDPKFRRVLSGVWKHQMSDAVWERVRRIQATVSDPLPAMRPFDGDA